MLVQGRLSFVHLCLLEDFKFFFFDECSLFHRRKLTGSNYNYVRLFKGPIQIEAPAPVLWIFEFDSLG